MWKESPSSANELESNPPIYSSNAKLVVKINVMYNIFFEYAWNFIVFFMMKICLYHFVLLIFVISLL